MTSGLLTTPRSEPADVEESLAERFAAQVGAHADQLAVCSTKHQWTYRRLDQVSSHLCGNISAAKSDESPIALLMDHDAPLIAAILASVKLGQPYVVLNPADPLARQQQVFRQSGATILAVDEGNAGKAANFSKPFVRFTQHETDSPPIALRKVSADEVASITFTSGTTGTPKGVCQTHRALLHHCRNYTLMAQLSAADRISLITPCHLAASMSSLWGALLNGATLLPFDLAKSGFNALANWVRDQRLTVLHCVPTVLRTLAALPTDHLAARLQSLRLLRLGGEAVRISDIDLFKMHTDASCILLVAYSSTETGAASMMVLKHDCRVCGNRVPVGRPMEGMNIRILDDSHHPVTPGEIGRILVASRYLSSGYWRDPELTAQCFRPDPDDPSLRQLDTGDLGRITAEGLLEHHGRADGRLKIHGHRINPDEVEAALVSVGGIREAAVVGEANSAGDLALIAYLGGQVSAMPGDGALRRKLRDVLPDHMIPAQFIHLERLPRTAGGKIDRLSLAHRERTGATVAEDSDQSRHNRDLESRIMAALQEVTSGGPIGKYDHFFNDLGLDSIQAVRAALNLERRLGRRLDAATLLRYPTIQSLAEHLHGSAGDVGAALLALIQAGESNRTPLFFAHGDVFGGGAYCHNLARQIGADRPFWTFPPLGLAGRSRPLTIRQMAARFVHAVRAIQRDGPYLLGGFCNGGLVAYEAARQLVSDGQQVKVLALVRCYIGRARWPGVPRLINALGAASGIDEYARLSFAVRTLDQLQGWREASDRGVASQFDYLTRLRRKFGPSVVPSTDPAGLSEVTLDTHGKDIVLRLRRAMLNHVPGRYAGSIQFFWPEQEADLLHGDISGGWSRYARKVISHGVPGEHMSCLTEHADVLAKYLRRYLNGI